MSTVVVRVGRDCAELSGTPSMKQHKAARAVRAETVTIISLWTQNQCHGSGLVAVHRRTGADQMAIPIGFINAADCRPELVGSDRWSRECRLLSRIGPIPVRGRDGGRRGDRHRAGACPAASAARPAGECGSEERRVGKECREMGRSRWSPYH